MVFFTPKFIDFDIGGIKSRAKGKQNANKFDLVDNYKYKYIHKMSGGRKTKIIQCGYEGCDKQFSKSWNFMDHARMHEGIKPYKCFLCDKRFTQKGNLMKHERMHKTTLADELPPPIEEFFDPPMPPIPSIPDEFEPEPVDPLENLVLLEPMPAPAPVPVPEPTSQDPSPPT